jgi:hypothetical protein
MSGGRELEQVVANGDVGISIMAGEEADAIAEVLREEMGDSLRIKDCITYLKFETDSGQIEVRFDAVADVLGRHFTMHEFQEVFASYYGRPHLVDDRLGVYASMTAGVRDDEDTE